MTKSVDPIANREAVRGRSDVLSCTKGLLFDARQHQEDEDCCLKFVVTPSTCRCHYQCVRSAPLVLW